MQEFLYIVDSANYNGKTFEQCNNDHNGTLVALNWDDYYNMYLSQHLKSIQKPFAETTEDRYWNALEDVK